MRPALRRYTNLPGEPVSVTALLRAVMPAPDLERWKQRTTGELARQYPDEPLDGIIDRHSSAAPRGTSVHRAIASYLSGRELPKMEHDAEVMYHQWYRWWAGQPARDMLAVEETVIGDGWAGTPDAILAGQCHVLYDWKTATHIPAEPYPEHVAQLGAYASFRGWAYARAPRPTIDRAYVVYIGSDAVQPYEVDVGKATALWEATLAFADALWPDLRSLGVVR